MKICKTNILFEQSKQSLSGEITADAPLALDRSGIVAEADADILLKLDDNGELVILKNSAKSVVLERNGRRLSLASRPIRICEKDIIHIEDARLDIVRSTFMMSRPSRKFGTASRVLAASAALCSLALTACEENCNNGETKCENNDVYECKDNSWALKQVCEDDLYSICKVYDNQAQCIPTVTEGVMPAYECWGDESKCQDNKTYVCKDHAWVLENDCSAGDSYAVCEMQENKAVCVEAPIEGAMIYEECQLGESKCEDNAVYVCKDSMWSKLNDCNDIPGASCKMLDNKAQCILLEVSGEPKYECEAGSYKCEDNIVVVCDDGQWVKNEDCNDIPGASCEMIDNKAQCLVREVEGDMMPDCMYGESKCEDNAVYVCDGGTWSLSEECKGITECVEMDNGAACVEMALSGVMPPEPIPVPEDPDPAKPE